MDALELFNELPRPGVFIFYTFIFGLGPSVVIILTSFLKISVVLMILRQALGLQNIPSNTALNGLALILSVYVMAPVSYSVYQEFEKREVDMGDLGNQQTREAFTASLEPMRFFLSKHSGEAQKQFFFLNAERFIGERMGSVIDSEDFIVLIPAFTVSQLKSAFEIGFLIYLPFIVIDLIVSNVLLALGMMMVSPMTISLPFKLLLFVAVDGWSRLIEGLILSFV